MLQQVFQEASTYRGILKSLGREIARSKYSDALSILDYEQENQEGLYQQVAANVQALLNEGLFLRNGVDENVDPNLDFFFNDLTNSSIFRIEPITSLIHALKN